MLHSPMDILQACEEDAKRLVGIVLTTKSVRLQTEYMGTRKTKVTLNGMPMDIKRSDWRVFSKFGDVEDVSAAAGKMGIATGDYVLQITVQKELYGHLRHTILSRPEHSCDRESPPHCWSCGAAGYLSKAFPRKESGTETSNSRSTSIAQISSTQRSSGGRKVRPDLQWLQQSGRRSGGGEKVDYSPLSSSISHQQGLYLQTNSRSSPRSSSSSSHRSSSSQKGSDRSLP